MLSIFRTNQSYVSLLLPFYALLLQLPALIWGPPLTENEATTVLGQFVATTVYTSRWVTLLLPVFLVGLSGLLVNRFCTLYQLGRVNTQIPGLFVVLLWGLCPPCHIFHPLQLAGLCLILALLSVGTIYRRNEPGIYLFNAGVWLGIGSLFQAELLIFAPAFVVAIGLLKTANLQSVLQLLLGLFVALFLAGTWNYWMGNLDAFLAGQQILPGLPQVIPAGIPSLIGLITTGLLLLVVLVSSGTVRGLLKMEGSKNVAILYWFMLFAPLALLLGLPFSVTSVQIVLVPLGGLLGLWVVRLPNNTAALFHLLLLAGVLILTTLSVVNSPFIN